MLPYRFLVLITDFLEQKAMAGELFEMNIWPGDPEGQFECIHGDQWDEVDEIFHGMHEDHRFSARTAFKLPIDSDALTFVARGAYTYGHVDVVAGDGDDVSVEILAHYHERQALDRVTVCRFHYDHDGRDGVGIFVRLRSMARVMHKTNLPIE